MQAGRATPNSETSFSPSFQGPHLAPIPHPAHPRQEASEDSGTCTLIQEISQEATQDRLVADDQHILLTLQLHNYRLQALDEVLVRLQDRGTGSCAAAEARGVVRWGAGGGGGDGRGCLPLGHPDCEAEDMQSVDQPTPQVSVLQPPGVLETHLNWLPRKGECVEKHSSARTQACVLLLSHCSIPFLTLYTTQGSDELTHAATWMNLESVTLSDSSQTQKTAYCLSPCIVNVQNKQLQRQKGAPWLSAARGTGNQDHC